MIHSFIHSLVNIISQLDSVQQTGCTNISLLGNKFNLIHYLLL